MQPPNQKIGKKEPKNTESKIGAPSPRANHTATFVPTQNKVYIIGGHGGVGYARRAFSDVHTYDVETHEWKKEDIVGMSIKERGGHTACLLPNSERIFVYGGWNSSTQFENFFIYDCSTKEWIDLDTNNSDPCRWSHSATIVPALPEAKIFFFGGSSESFEEGSQRKFAKLSNLTGFININGNLKQSKWSIVNPEHSENTPKARESTAMVYDDDMNRLIVFGGWSNTYLDDIYELNISKITGPSYAIYNMKPTIGPYTGGTSCLITGEGFFPNRSYNVNFRAGKYSIDVVAKYISATEIECLTPSFEQYGPRMVEVKVFQDRGDLTLTHVNFEYFYNTMPEKTIAFGPGLLSANKCNSETIFIVQTRNKKNENRESGNDANKVEIYTEHEETIEDAEGETHAEMVKTIIPCEIKDVNNGTYEVTYTYDKEGEVLINVFFGDDKGEMKPIRGAPYKAKFVEDVPEENNKFTGPQMTHHMEKRLKEIKSFIHETSKGINTSDEKYKSDVKALLKIKENSQRIEQEKDINLLDLEVIEEALNHYHKKRVEKKGQLEEAKTLIVDMGRLQEECFETENKISAKLKEERKNTEKELDDFEKELKRYYINDLKKQNYTEYSTGFTEAIKSIEIIEAKVDEFETRMKDYEYYTKMFDMQEGTGSSRKTLLGIQEEIVALRELWEHINVIQETYEKFKQAEWKDIISAEMEDETKALQKKLTKIKKIDKKINTYGEANRYIKNWINFLPLIGELKSNAMEVEDDRHWNNFREQLNTDLVVEESTKLEVFWDLQLYIPHKKDCVDEITERAKQEKKIESNIEIIEKKWKSVNFARVPLELKESTIDSVKMEEEEVEVLEEHQLLIQNTAANKFIAQFEEEVKKWQDGLSKVNDTISLLAEVQKTWSFLINLFIYSEEVKKELPQYSQDFVEIDKEMRRLLEFSKIHENVFQFCNTEYEDDGEREEEEQEFFVLNKLEKISSELAACQKGLNDFIASKRKVFPRFFFLTMEELLDILANGNNPRLLFKEKNYMNKVVQAVDKLEMKDGAEGARPTITEMSAAIGKETVVFVGGGIQLVDKVENYLMDVLELIIKTIKTNAKEALTNFVEKGEEKKNWIEATLSQLNLLSNATRWVDTTEKTFDLISENSDAMKNFLAKVKDSLNELITYVQGKLEKPTRIKMMTLITIETHNRDVIEKLVKEKVIKADAFQWQSQLKFYFDAQTGDFKIRIADAALAYGYEYLGNGPRLVVTPLTDRIYVTATQALHLKMGCAPAGPAGTGKTETTKDLSAAVGKACYVFNCSGEMNYQTMGNIFKGLAASGCWGCFDEFNRLVPEVLSVCTVQFKAVLDGIKAGLSKFRMDEGDEIHLDPTCGAFITMNPGYLGRAELPEGLKALFRPITVVVPDLELICENMLMAEGFQDAKVLARKFVTLYKLSQDLLSKQRHYDWGLRAIKSVLVVAGAFKREDTVLKDELKLLFRALRDFNDPKIAEVDKGIFEGLLAALFPGCETVPRQRNLDFEKIIKEETIKKQMSDHDQFIKKVVQLRELLEIRHCVFLMGPPGSGRTSTWKILKEAQTAFGEKTTVQDIDPKTVSTRDLYGYTNMTTKEWKNGLLSHFMQYFSEELTDGNPKWIVLDGDLDANWIESMNSVMDDNKLLTLANNGRIILKGYMKMLFEIRNLVYATPATVSRAGILYISDDSGYQLDCYYDSWAKRAINEWQADSLTKLAGKNLEELEYHMNRFRREYIPQIIDFLKKAKFVTPVSYHGMTVTLCKLFHYFISTQKQYLTIGEEKDRQIDINKLEHLFCISAVWAFGGVLITKDNEDWRKKFSDYWKSTFKKVKFPSKGGVYDFYVSIEERPIFDEWKSKLSKVQFAEKFNMKDITIPIPETLSIAELTRNLIEMSHPVLFVGNSGSGKTQLVNGILKKLKADRPEEYYSTSINFNYYTDSDYLVTMLEQELVKQGNRYGPKKGGKFKLIYFIDDLNMPQLDPYDTQSAVALLRQHIDYSHWFDISKVVPVLKEINNTLTLAAMNPTSGSFFVNPRYQRHFWLTSIGFPENSSLIIIYESFLEAHFQKGFKNDIQNLAGPLIKTAIGLHERVCKEFRKTALNFHYEFNIRHLSDIFSGILRATSSQYNDVEKVVRLWIHESERIYCDRLVNRDHIDQYYAIVVDTLKKSFSKYTSIQKFYLKDSKDRLLFHDFPKGYEGDRVYVNVSFEDSDHHVKQALEAYNESNIEMKLILFMDAICHVCRITRIITQNSGHALLVGVGGSGKQSLSRLSSFMCEMEPFTMTVSSTYSTEQLKGDLVELYKKTGEKGYSVMFMITDSHITDERFLVYINDLLASGEIAELYAEDDKIAIINGLKNKAKSENIDPTNDNVWQFFINRVKEYLHVVLCFSPVGDMFRTRARRFPGLVNCTVIDWFQPWPEDALRAVSNNLLHDTLKEVEMEDAESIKNVVEFMPNSFKAAEETGKRIFKMERRTVHNTPKSFLELIKLFNSMLISKRDELIKEKDTYETGLAKLIDAEEKVMILEAELKIKNVEVSKQKEEASIIAERVGKEEAKVQIQNDAAKVKENLCTEISKEVEQQQQICEAEVSKLQPMVNEALEKVKNLNEQDVKFVRSFNNPPNGIPEVFYCIMYMFGGVKGVEYDYSVSIDLNKKSLPRDINWKSAKKMMANPSLFIKQLINYPSEINAANVPAQNFKEVKKITEDPIFKELFSDPETMKAKSEAAYGVLLFVVNMINYYEAMTEMIPKREALEIASLKKDKATTELNEVQELVRGLNEELEEKRQELRAAEKVRDAAQAEFDKCMNMLSLAKRLVNALGSEKGRWGENILSLEEQVKVVVGDVLVASAFISYCGPFTKPYREFLMNERILPYMKERKIPMSPKFNPVKFMVDDATKAEWNNDGLPSDDVSVENGAILVNSARYPLMIDPQLQGISWIKEKLKADELIAMRIGSKNYINRIERAIEDGTPVLLENLEENIDPIIFPVIARNTIKRNGKIFLSFGGNNLEIHPSFRLYLQTKLSNPNYPPEIQAESALINFMVTEQGLGDQLLSLVVSRERPDLDRKKRQLIKEQNKFKIQLKSLEKELLDLLNNNKSNLLENIELIEKLEKSKELSTEINKKVEIAKATEVMIVEASEAYRPVAVRGALIFFLMNELYKMSSFYMYSLESFVNVINLAIDIISEKKEEENATEQGDKQAGEEGGENQEENQDENEEKDGSGDEKEDEEKEAAEEAEAKEKEGEEQEEIAEQEEKEGEDGEAEQDLKEEDNKVEVEEGQEADEDEDNEDRKNIKVPEPKAGKEIEEEEEEEGEIQEAKTPRTLKKRVDLLTETITYCAFNSVRRGLFEIHKLIFSTLLCFRILVNLKKLHNEEVEHLIFGKVLKSRVPYPESENLRSYISEQMYMDCKALEYIDDFNGICDSLISDNLSWKKWFGAEKAEEADLPKTFNNITVFHKLMLIKALRPDRMTYSLKSFDSEQMGKTYVEQEPFKIEEVFRETSPQTPLFFVLFPGVDPTPEVEAHGATLDISSSNGRFVNISMGQGQEEKAIEELKNACQNGTWIFLQNVHLMQSWLKIFERKFEEYAATAHNNFRCFVSSEPPPALLPTQKIVPESVLQRCIKISNESPSDLMANLRRAFSKFDEERLNNAPQSPVFKSIITGLCYFHAVVLGRKKFGSAGWSRVYNFNDGDLTICADVLENYLSKYEKVPYDDLRYIYGEIMYGGHITDDWDRRTNNTYLRVIITPELLNGSNIVPFSKKVFRVPESKKAKYQDYWNFIDLFGDERPFMFGMHSNAEINFLTNQCEYTFNTIIDIRGGASGGGAEGEQGAMHFVETYKKAPQPFSLIELKDKVIGINREAAGVKTKSGDDALTYPPTPYQNVALQEMETMSVLLTEILTTLDELELGLKGELNMTDAMEKLSSSLMLNRVPDNWGVFYFSKKPLASWFTDLKARKEQLDEWAESFVILKSTCLSYLFNPMSFLTAIMQVTASEQGEALDSMCIFTKITHYNEPEEIKGEEEEPEDKGEEEKIDPYKNSIFIHGMFLEGAAWEPSARGGYLTEMKPKELHPPLPVIAVDAILLANRSMKAQYPCPVYYTTQRGPTFVFTANLNMEADEPSLCDKWILGGVAAIMNEDL